jgi:hypothetical protein
MMKKTFLLIAAVVILASCGQSDDGPDGDTASGTTKLKIRNESSVTLENVKWNDETFNSGTTTLASGSTVTSTVSKDKAEDGTGFIYFNKGNLACRTKNIVSFAESDTFVFTDHTVVIDMNNTTN